jgi:type IV pilus assembly protein PilP
MRPTRFLLSLLIVATAMATLVAQSPRAASATASSSTIATTSAQSPESTVQQSLQEILEEPNSADAYHYDPKGRRDPFQSLIGPAPTLQPGQRPPGPPGFLIDEIKLQGVVKMRQQGLVAMVNGPDNKGYLVKVGDKVLDGEVIRITPASIVFRQEVNDPTRIERFREVVKELSSEAPRK